MSDSSFKDVIDSIRRGALGTVDFVGQEVPGASAVRNIR